MTNLIQMKKTLCNSALLLSYQTPTKTPQKSCLTKVNTFATSLCLLAFSAVADAEPTSHTEASITGADGGWKVDKFIDTITSKISIPDRPMTGQQSLFH